MDYPIRTGFSCFRSHHSGSATGEATWKVSMKGDSKTIHACQIHLGMACLKLASEHDEPMENQPIEVWRLPHWKANDEVSST